MRIRKYDVGTNDDNIPFVYVIEGTGNKRYNMLSEDVYSYYLEYISNRTDGFLFSSDGKEPYETRTLQKQLAKACREVFDDTTFTFNDLRNTGIVLANAGGASIDDIAGRKTINSFEKI